MTPLTWNADREVLTARRSRTAFGVGWRNFLNPGANEPWRRIDAAVQSDLSVTAFPGNVQFPASSQDWTDMLFDGAFSMRRYVDEKNGNNPEPEFGLQLAVETQHNVSGHIDESRPWQVLYSNAWGSAHLRLGIWHGRAARIEKVVEIHSEPSGSDEFVEYSFLLRSSTAKIWTGKTLDVRPWTGTPGEFVSLHNGEAFIARADSWIRGAMLRNPVAWYYRSTGEMVRVPIEVRFMITAIDTVRATKRIPRALIQAAIAEGSSLYTDATFTPDANPESSTCDWMVKGTTVNASWATVLAQSGNYSTDSEATSNMLVESTSTTNQYAQYRHLGFLFDTSSIGSGQQVDSASLALRMDRQSSSGHDLSIYHQIYTSSPASNTAVANGDFMSLGSTPLTDTARHLYGESFDWTTIDREFNSDGRDAVDMEGITKLGLGLVEAHESGSPAWSSGKTDTLAVMMSEATGTSNDPTLTVTHSAAGPAIPVLVHHYNQQGL